MGQIGHLSKKVTDLFSKCQHFPKLDNPWGTWKGQMLAYLVGGQDKTSQVKLIRGSTGQWSPYYNLTSQGGQDSTSSCMFNFTQRALYLCFLTAHHGTWPHVTYGPAWASFKEVRQLFPICKHVQHLISQGVVERTTACLVLWCPIQDLTSQVD